MRTKNKCKAAWKAWEAGYAKKEGGKQEAARERREFYCVKGTSASSDGLSFIVPLSQ